MKTTRTTQADLGYTVTHNTTLIIGKKQRHKIHFIQYNIGGADKDHKDEYTTNTERPKVEDVTTT